MVAFAFVFINCCILHTFLCTNINIPHHDHGTFCVEGQRVYEIVKEKDARGTGFYELWVSRFYNRIRCTTAVRYWSSWSTAARTPFCFCRSCPRPSNAALEDVENGVKCKIPWSVYAEFAPRLVGSGFRSCLAGAVLNSEPSQSLVNAQVCLHVTTYD